MLWRVWAAIGGVVCGVAVAALLGGGIPTRVKLTLLAVVLAGVVTTVVLRLASRPKAGSDSPWAVVANDHRSLPDSDYDTVARVYGLIPERELDWLRSETFAASWLDDEVGLLRELARFDPDGSGTFDPALTAAIARLVAAADAFMGVYDVTTIADPIMRDTRWRVVGSPAPDGAADDPADDDRIASRTRLRESAVEIVESYSAFSAAARASFPPT